jgi:hypothetical protein
MMQKIASGKSKILLICSIVLAVFFYTLFLLDYLEIETYTLRIIRGILIIPFFLTQIALPVMIFIKIYRSKNENRNPLGYAAVISSVTIFLIFLMTFFYN